MHSATVEEMSAFRSQLVALLPRLRRFATAMCGSSHEAEDLVQGALERALRSEGLWERGSRLDSWMFRMIQNLWRDELRAHRRRSEPLDDIAEHAGEDGRDVMVHTLQVREVHAALQLLPAAQRSVLALVVLDGMSYQQAAALLGVPIGTVMSRLARARAALAKSLDANEPRMKIVKP
jgi:RNA polymerase sigma-70 factor, ECF subfamily